MRRSTTPTPPSHPINASPLDRLGDFDPAPVGVYRLEGGKLVGERVVRASVDTVGG